VGAQDVVKNPVNVSGAEHPGFVDDQNRPGRQTGLLRVWVGMIEVRQQPGDGERRDSGASFQFGGGGRFHRAPQDGMACGAPGLLGGEKAAGFPGAGGADDDVDKVAGPAQLGHHPFLLFAQRTGGMFLGARMFCSSGGAVGIV
jgi:hypothetical protein